MEAVSLVGLAASITKVSPLLIKGITWVLDFKKDLENISRTLDTIQHILTHGDEVQTNPIMQNWFQDLKDAAYDAEDLLDTLSTTVYLRQQKQVRGFEGVYNVIHQIYGQFKIRKINERFNQIRERAEFIRTVSKTDEGEGEGERGGMLKLRHTVSQVNESAVVGRARDKQKLINMLLDGEYDTEGGVTIIPIIGMSGVGKTTLAQLVFNDDKVEERFGNNRRWVCVTINFDLSRILIEMMQEMENTHSSPDQLHSCFGDFISRRRFLLVLDDVWADKYDQWEQLLFLLSRGAKESRVLITTQKAQVCRAVGMKKPHSLDYLNDDDCWSLFQRTAFMEGRCPPELEEFGREIVSKCQGLPLAVKLMGGLMRGNTDEKEWRKISMTNICEAEKQPSKSLNPNILPVLKLSFNHLPVYLKPCFAYCSIFPKGYLFDKKVMVQLWMAEGLIQSDGQQRMEEIGTGLFNELVLRSFFQRFINVDDSKVKYYRMHNLFHDLAECISGAYCCQVIQEYMQSNLTPKMKINRLRHVSLIMCENVEQPVLKIINEAKKLRTLLFPSGHLKDFGDTLHVMFKTFKCIRVLDLSSSTISRLPKSIGKLKLLRYLDLSKTEIIMLPDAICNLCNLQTLKLLGCLSLLKLPHEFGKLVSLRHLELDKRFWHKSSTMLPPGIGRLTSLHNLHTFQIRLENGYGIEELRGMVYLTGTLHISKLENAGNAEEANLKSKERLHKLVLEWSRVDGPGDEAEEERILADLQPHTNLKEIQICRYRGSIFPVWMKEGHLQNLVTLSLNHCTKCKTLSISTGLPHLEELYIKEMRELEVWVELEINQFRSLHVLKIGDCPKLRKLPQRFPCLTSLKIESCYSLKALSETPCLEVLTLVDNLALEDFKEVNYSYQNLLELRINCCPKLRVLPLHFSPLKLEISGCESLTSLLAFEHYSRHLRHLALDGCQNGLLVGAIPETSSLFSLVVSNISNVASFPKWPRLHRLKALHIHLCRDLVSLSEEQGAFQGLNYLKLLSIQGCPQLVALPGEGLPKTLECLALDSCPNLVSLGPKDVLRSLTCLKDLYIMDCPSLKSLPVKGVSASLQHLVIQGCPTLMERCRKDADNGGSRGPDWQKIMNIPDLEIGCSMVLSSSDFPKHTQEPTASPNPAERHVTAWCHHFMCCKWAESNGKEAGGPSTLTRHRSNFKEPPQVQGSADKRPHSEGREQVDISSLAVGTQNSECAEQADVSSIAEPGTNFGSKEQIIELSSLEKGANLKEAPQVEGFAEQRTNCECEDHVEKSNLVEDGNCERKEPTGLSSLEEDGKASEGNQSDELPSLEEIDPLPSSIVSGNMLIQFQHNRTCGCGQVATIKIHGQQLFYCCSTDSCGYFESWCPGQDYRRSNVDEKDINHDVIAELRALQSSYNFIKIIIVISAVANAFLLFFVLMILKK